MISKRKGKAKGGYSTSEDKANLSQDKANLSAKPFALFLRRRINKHCTVHGWHKP